MHAQLTTCRRHCRSLEFALRDALCSPTLRSGNPVAMVSLALPHAPPLRDRRAAPWKLSPDSKREKRQGSSVLFPVSQRSLVVTAWWSGFQEQPFSIFSPSGGGFSWVGTASRHPNLGQTCKLRAAEFGSHAPGSADTSHPGSDDSS